MMDFFFCRGDNTEEETRACLFVVYTRGTVKVEMKEERNRSYILLSLTIQGTIFPGITFQFETIDRTNDARTRCMKTQTKDQSQFAIKVVYTWRLAQHNRFGYVNICIYRENVRVCASVFWLKIYRA